MKYGIYEFIHEGMYGGNAQYTLEHWIDFDTKQEAIEYIKELNGSRKFTILEVY